MTYPLGFRGDGVGGVLMFLRADELASSYSPSREGFARFRLLVVLYANLLSLPGLICANPKGAVHASPAVIID